ncbi:Cysteine/Histidine-rich C1 domain family protein [Raphanus sativus]|uniref:Uncharacterized protein LOC108845044 n=1 Tax=Raphanus sativus TaxID=3726 RepID=A0A6J0MMV2_RAPSA|nr:uncharacterized protein LOC108845044 [Raphanus sativus]KAJ4906095.1 Cysteine/Histidine-rich C1 domain family protein [Raphanus sativus]
MNKKRVPPPPPALPSCPPPSLHSTPPASHTFMNELLTQLSSKVKCPLSHLTHPHILRSKPNGNTKSDCFSCGLQTSFVSGSVLHYYCTTCDVEFHLGCHKFPRKLGHPYHPQHPLTFTYRDSQSGIISEGNIDESFCREILSDSSTSDPEKLLSWSQSDLVVDKCTWCANAIEGNWFYRCSICNFSLDLSCFRNFPLQTINKPKSHHHPLVFYPRPLLTPCDACGLVNVLNPSYACFQCNYMVHQSCIDLPRVIKITRHQHRLSHTPYIEAVTSPCRICYRPVDIKYGQYTCNQEDCSYVAHSKCATHENVWDGEELEWEPEKYDKSEDINPFIKVGANLIKYFSHEHLMKLEKYDGVRDGEKQCQACVLPIDSRDFYNCVQCDFFLHEVCAGLLRKIDHALHVHSLVLDPSRYSTQKDYGWLTECSVCSRNFSGFKYKCSEKNCVAQERFQIDVLCTLVPDYFTHESHDHPLFISTSYKGKNKIWCEGCKGICMQSYLQCSVCKFALCYQCATIPNEICYKYDKHPLSLCYGEEVRDGMYYWCEVCEKKVNPTDWFYTCNECSITIHVKCMFGPTIYLMPGFVFKDLSSTVKVLRNSSSTRPLCDSCGHRCPSSVYYRSHNFTKVSCSLNCLETVSLSLVRLGQPPSSPIRLRHQIQL